MSTHDGQRQSVVRERLALPILLPVGALIATVALIVAIGELLLAFGGEGQYLSLGDEHVVYPVFIALALTVVVLFGAVLVARTWAKDE